MLFQDEATAAITLQTISYYRLKGYWWAMQSDVRNHTFYPNVYFENAVLIYQFDRKLRAILFEAVEMVEISLRAKLIYHLSQRFTGLWYLNNAVIHDTLRQTEILTDIFVEFDRSSEVFIADHKRRFPNLKPDAWKLFEVVSLGLLSKQYKNLAHQLPEKSLIANEFGLRLHSELSSWLEAINYLRNIIAHHSRIYDRAMVKFPSDIINPAANWLLNPPTGYQRKKPYYIISALVYLCNALNPSHILKDKLLDLFDDYPTVPINRLGFVGQWKSEPLWQE